MNESPIPSGGPKFRQAVDLVLVNQFKRNLLAYCSIVIEQIYQGPQVLMKYPTFGSRSGMA